MVLDTVRRLRGGLGWWDAFATPGPTRLLATHALVDAAGSGLYALCLPFFLISVVRLSPADLAFALAAAGVAELLCSVPAGVLAGRFGVWRYAIVTRLVRAAGYLALAAASSFWTVLAAAVFVGMLRAANRGIYQSIATAVIGESSRSRMLGVMRALRNMGFLLAGGAGAVLLLFPSPTVLRAGIVANAVSLLVSVWCVSRLRPDRVEHRARRTDWSVLKDLEYFGLVLAGGVFSCTVLVIDIAIPLWVIGHSLPRTTVAVVVVVSTLLIVTLQYRFSRRSETTVQALGALRWSVVCFAAGAALIAGSGGTAVLLSVGLLVLGGVMLTLAQMTESPAWWTLSYHLAPEHRKTEYLGAFDVGSALLNIVGPPAMVLVVTGGWIGWLCLAGAVLVAELVTRVIVARRAPDPATVP